MPKSQNPQELLYEGPFTIEVDGEVKGTPLNSWEEAMGAANCQRSLKAGSSVLVRNRYQDVVLEDTELKGGEAIRGG